MNTNALFTLHIRAGACSNIYKASFVLLGYDFDDDNLDVSVTIIKVRR